MGMDTLVLQVAGLVSLMYAVSGARIESRRHPSPSWRVDRTRSGFTERHENGSSAMLKSTSISAQDTCAAGRKGALSTSSRLIKASETPVLATRRGNPSYTTGTILGSFSHSRNASVIRCMRLSVLQLQG